MGIVVSKHVDTSEFTLTTGIIGLVSFGFTLGTFFKVVWVNLTTLGEAEQEVHAYLTTLRTELLEEKASLRTMRKGLRKYQKACRREGVEDQTGMELDEVSLRTIGDTIKHLIRRFRALERPFLQDGESGIAEAPSHRTRARRRRNSSSSPPHYAHAAYSSPPEKPNGRARTNYDRELDEEVDDDAYWAQRTKYANYTLLSRLRWLRSKSEAEDLFNTLSRVQIRRIALQVGGLAIAMHTYGTDNIEMQKMVRRIDERVNRVVGVRRVDS